MLLKQKTPAPAHRLSVPHDTYTIEFPRLDECPQIRAARPALRAVSETKKGDKEGSRGRLSRELTQQRHYDRPRPSSYSETLIPP
jgi:hypothetical protein